MTHLTYKLLIYIVDILNNSATVDETKAKRLAGSKSEDRVLTFVPTFRFVADNFLNISKNCYTIRYKNSIIIKLEKCRFCGIGFTLELFCQSRRMMSIHNLPYRIEENITPGGNSGPIGCMERCRDNSDCKVNYFILDYWISMVFRDTSTTMGIWSKHVLFTRILMINFFHLWKMVRPEFSVKVKLIHTMIHFRLLDESVKTTIATNLRKYSYPLIKFLICPRSSNKILTPFLYQLAPHRNHDI